MAYDGLVLRDCGRYGYLHIYGLVDPRTGEIRYVGRTFALNMKYRYGTHVRGFDDRTRHWVYDLASEGRVPSLCILETVAEEDYDSRIEQRWYGRLRERGCDLLNRKRPVPRTWRHRRVRA